MEQTVNEKGLTCSSPVAPRTLTEQNGEEVGENASNNRLLKEGDVWDGGCFGKIKKLDEGDAVQNVSPTYGEVVARMPTDKYATHYNMNHKHRGMALIFNHEHFDYQPRRAGTEFDKDALENVFRDLQFFVRGCQDLTLASIEENLDDIAKHNHNDYDCLVVVVMTHGDTGTLWAKDKQYRLDTLWDRFTADKCPTLAGKPKIFFIQACQGTNVDNGVILQMQVQRTLTDGPPISYKIPTQADFLVFYSTPEGFYSWRTPEKGSWFIQTLCNELRSRANELDLLNILIFVNQRVAIDYQSNVPNNPSKHQQKQMPVLLATLTRMISFNKKKKVPPSIGHNFRFDNSAK